MNVDEINEQLESSRERLLLLLQVLPDELLSDPGIMEDWSVTDVLTHLIAWESELVTCLMNLDQGKKPARMLAAIADVDGYNARRFEENKGRSLDRVLDDLKSVRVQLEEWLSRFSDRDLNDADRYKWSEGVVLWQIIEANSFGHEGEHLPDLEAFVRGWQDEQAAI
ncbi:MAG: ClbS/DfsB family four-helix bundle protein [Candidatus Promineifilaceae bacterium]